MRTKITLLFLLTISIIIFSIIKSTDNYSDFLNREFLKLNSFDKPDKSGFRDFLMTQDTKLNRVPTERLAKAYKTKKSLSAIKNIDDLDWNETQGNLGGRTRDIMYDPTDSTHKKVWACSVTGGLWYNADISDSTNTWVSVSDAWSTMATSNICFDPNNPAIFYVGTGEVETAIHIYRESSGRGFGIWKSIDAGLNWEQMPSTSDFAYVSDIEVRNESELSVIYAGVMSGEYKGATFQSTPTDGLYRSADNGASWTQVLPNIIGKDVPYAVSDIEISGDNIYVGTTNNLNNEGGSCILKSNTGLANSWTINTDYKDAITSDSEFNIPGRVELSSSESNPSIVYAIIGAGSDTELLEGFGTAKGKYIVKTTDSGLTWDYINIPNEDNSGRNWAYLSWHAFSISVKPDDANTIFIGGLDIYKSEDGGNSWNKVSDWVLMYYGGGDQYVHGDIHKISFNPFNNNEFSVVTDGGVFYTNSANSNEPIFYPRNKSFNTFQFYTCGLSPETGDTLYSGGLQDNGTFLYTNQPYEIDDMYQGGDGAYTMFDKNNASTLITSTYDNSIMVFYDGGYTQINEYTSGTFISPFDFDSENKIIYSNAITFTGDYPDQIFKVSELPDTHTDEFIFVNTGTETPFSAVRFTKTNNETQTLLVGNYTGCIYKIDNINTSPSSQQIDNGQLPEAYVSCIQTSKNADTVLVTFSNYGVQSVWQTYNGGGLWTDISGNLPDMPIRWAIYHPNNKQKIMLATEIGIWITDDANATNIVWRPQNSTFPNVRVDMLNVRPGDNFVVAATHGRSMFTSTWDIVSGVKEMQTEENISINIYPNPATNNLNVNFNNLDIVKIDIISTNGKVLLSNEISNKNVLHSINIAHLSIGKYVLRYYYKNGKLKTENFVKL